MVKLTKEVSPKSSPATLPDSRDAIGSLELELGPMPCDAQNSPMTDLFGQAVAPARVSAPQEKAKGLATLVTSGLIGSDSSASAALQQSFENRLMQRLDTDGSTLFKLTWRQRITPLGRRYLERAASGHRTSGNGCTSWVSPTAQDHSRGGKPARPWDTGVPLSQQAALAPWPSPVASKNTPQQRKDFTPNLANVARLASWATPRANASTESHTAAKSRGTRPNKNGDNLEGQALLTVSGETPSGSPAGTEKHGQLNPRFSLWLQGLPTAWACCGERVTLSRPRSRKRSSRRT